MLFHNEQVGRRAGTLQRDLIKMLFQNKQVGRRAGTLQRY
jgi:hypothetical protein